MTSQTGAEIPNGGEQIYYLVKFCQKLHKNEENWTEGASKILPRGFESGALNRTQ